MSYGDYNINYDNRLTDLDSEYLYISRSIIEAPPAQTMVYVNVYDSLDNFIFNKKLPYDDLNFEIESEEDFSNYIVEGIIAENTGSLAPGLYKLTFDFLLDSFNYVENENRKYIVTEISSDKTEVRLNPISNESDFIQLFTEFKGYNKIDVEVTGSDLESFRDYIPTIKNSVITTGLANLTFKKENIQYVRNYFVRTWDQSDETLYLYLISTFRSKYKELSLDDQVALSYEFATKVMNSMIDKYLSLGDSMTEYLLTYYDDEYESILQADLETVPEGNKESLNLLISTFKEDMIEKSKEYLNEDLKEYIKENINAILNEYE